MYSILNKMRKYSDQTLLPHLVNQSLNAREWLVDTQDLSSSSPLRVFIILSQRPSETGSGIYLREIVSELQGIGHQIYILAANYKPLTRADFKPLQEDHIFTTIFDDGTNSDISDIKFPIPGMSLDMPYLHKPFHSLSNKMLEEYCNIWSKKISSITKIIRPHIIHVNHLWLLPCITSLAVPWLPIIATYHGSELNLLKRSPAFGHLIKPGIQHLNIVMPVAKDSAQEAQDWFGVLPERTKIIGNGYNPKLFRVMPRLSGLTILREFQKKSTTKFEWQKLVLYVGKFADYKGLPYLIRAAKLYNTVDDGILTLIVGEGSDPIRKKLSDLINQLDLSNKILMPGKVPYNFVSSIMNIADVFVLPSLNEPFGLVFLEALACGIRGVAASKGGPPFFVPKVLLEKKMVSLINPLRLHSDQSPFVNDEDRYVCDLAKAIQFQVLSTTSDDDRQFIAHSVEDQTWKSRALEISNVYYNAIQHHRSEMTLTKA